MSEKIRTAVLWQGEKPKTQSRRETPEQIEAALLEKFKAESRFVADPGVRIEGVELVARKGDDSGRLIWRSDLFSILRDLGLEGRDESLVIEVIDALCAQRKLRIIEIRFDQDLSFRNLLIIAETGHAICGFSPNVTIPIIKIQRFFADHPLKIGEVPSGERSSLVASETIKRLREALEQELQKRYGWSREVEIEKALHREDVQARLKLGKAVLEIARREQK
jgi:hypothetical protein